MLRFLRIPTFSVMIMQGIFGGMPWTIMGALGETSCTTVAVFLYPGNLEDEAVSFFLEGVGGQKLDLLFFRGELP